MTKCKLKAAIRDDMTEYKKKTKGKLENTQEETPYEEDTSSTMFNTSYMVHKSLKEYCDRHVHSLCEDLKQDDVQQFIEYIINKSEGQLN